MGSKFPQSAPSQPSDLQVPLGATVADAITGFYGVVIGRLEYLTGCNQCLVSPKIGKDGTMRDSQWFDEQRLTVDADKKIVSLNNGKTPGFDRPAPKK